MKCPPEPRSEAARMREVFLVAQRVSWSALAKVPEWSGMRGVQIAEEMDAHPAPQH